MANLVESRTSGASLPAASNSFNDLVGASNTTASTALGGLGALSSDAKQSENPNLRNTAAEFRQLETIGGLTADQTAAGLVTGAVDIIRDDQRLAENIPTITGGQVQSGLLDSTDPRYSLDPTAGAIDVAVAPAAETIQTQDSRTGTEGQYDVASSVDAIEDVVAVGAEGTLSDDTVIDEAATIDIDATARGETALGDAMDDHVSYDIGNVIDTSTVAGKLLADELGEGNYIDSKATIKGQLDILAKDFTDANGNPVIPTWAASNYRGINRMMAFKGISGSAAMAAVSGALMESALDIAKGDSKFFETVTLRNLDNAQETTINRANILSKLEIANLDNRQEALVSNSKAFLALDLKNLDNDQQAELVNAEMRSQAIFDETNAVNIQRKFEAQTEVELMQTYDTLKVEVDQFNANQRQAHAEFVTNTDLAESKFNADLANQREQFEIKNQLLIDDTNAKWRQDITLTNTEMAFTAAATDIKNSLAISVEGLNRLWDQADSAFDYLWKATENELDRSSSLSQTIISGEYGEAASKRDASARKSAGRSAMMGSIIGGIIGLSDRRLKKNIKKVGRNLAGYGYYTWEWTDEALELGAAQYGTEGVIAQEIQEVYPEAVITNLDTGYLMVNYSLLETKAA